MNDEGQGLMTKREPGIYTVAEGLEWLVVDERGQENRFRAPLYDLAFLLDAYRGRLEHKGPLRSDPFPIQGKITVNVDAGGAWIEEHLPAGDKS